MPIPIICGEGSGKVDPKIFVSIYIVITVLSLVTAIICGMVDYFRNNKEYSFWSCIRDFLDLEGNFLGCLSSIIFLATQGVALLTILVLFVSGLL